MARTEGPNGPMSEETAVPQSQLTGDCPKVRPRPRRRQNLNNEGVGFAEDNVGEPCPMVAHDDVRAGHKPHLVKEGELFQDDLLKTALAENSPKAWGRAKPTAVGFGSTDVDSRSGRVSCSVGTKTISQESVDPAAANKSPRQ